MNLVVQELQQYIIYVHTLLKQYSIDLGVKKEVCTSSALQLYAPNQGVKGVGTAKSMAVGTKSSVCLKWPLN